MQSSALTTFHRSKSHFWSRFGRGSLIPGSPGPQATRVPRIRGQNARPLFISVLWSCLQTRVHTPGIAQFEMVEIGTFELCGRSRAGRGSHPRGR